MSYLPSEIARLVLGYLNEVKCPQTFKTFLSECPHLAEYAQFYARGRKYPTSIANRSLLDILSSDTSSPSCSPRKLIIDSHDSQPPVLPVVHLPQKITRESGVQTELQQADECIQTLFNDLANLGNQNTSRSSSHAVQHLSTYTPVVAPINHASDDNNSHAQSHDQLPDLFSLIGDSENPDSDPNHLHSESSLFQQGSIANDVLDPGSVASMSATDSDNSPWSSAHFSSPEPNRALMSETDSLNTPHLTSRTPSSVLRRQRNSPWDQRSTPHAASLHDSVRRNLMEQMASHDVSPVNTQQVRSDKNTAPHVVNNSSCSSQTVSTSNAPIRTNVIRKTPVKAPVKENQFAARPPPVSEAQKKNMKYKRQKIYVPDEVLREAQLNLQLTSQRSGNANNRISNKARTKSVDVAQTHHESNILSQAISESDVPYQVYYTTVGTASTDTLSASGTSSLGHSGSDGTQPSLHAPYIVSMDASLSEGHTSYPANNSESHEFVMPLNSDGLTIFSSSEIDADHSDAIEVDASLLESVNVDQFLRQHVHSSKSTAR